MVKCQMLHVVMVSVLHLAFVVAQKPGITQSRPLWNRVQTLVQSEAQLLDCAKAFVMWERKPNREINR